MVTDGEYIDITSEDLMHIEATKYFENKLEDVKTIFRDLPHEVKQLVLSMYYKKAYNVYNSIPLTITVQSGYKKKNPSGWLKRTIDLAIAYGLILKTNFTMLAEGQMSEVNADYYYLSEKGVNVIKFMRMTD
jgi:hypothetical protein